jgi:nitrate reductase (cytochrome)
VDLATRTTRTSYAADRALLFNPQTDLAIANAICHEIVARGRVNREFVDRHVAFKKGRTGIGYGLRDDFSFTDQAADASFDEYVRPSWPTTRPSGSRDLRHAGGGHPLARLPLRRSARRVMSLWCMGMNQHTRGTWINNLVYNIHLLDGEDRHAGQQPVLADGPAQRLRHGPGGGHADPPASPTGP